MIGRPLEAVYSISGRSTSSKEAISKARDRPHDGNGRRSDALRRRPFQCQRQQKLESGRDEAARKRQPSNGSVYSALAAVHRRQGRWSEARLQVCLPRLRRFLCSRPRRRGHQESSMRAWLEQRARACPDRQSQMA